MCWMFIVNIRYSLGTYYMFKQYIAIIAKTSSLSARLNKSIKSFSGLFNNNMGIYSGQPYGQPPPSNYSHGNIESSNFISIAKPCFIGALMKQD